jgi:hypothetical protein
LEVLMSNTELIEKVYNKIKQEPDSHEQYSWAKLTLERLDACHADSHFPFPFDPVEHTCNTVACVAGWACIMHDPSDLKVWLNGRLFYPEEEEYVFRDKAMSAMQIGSNLAWVLFDGNRTRFEVLWLLKQLINGESEEKILSQFNAEWLT